MAPWTAVNTAILAIPEETSRDRGGRDEQQSANLDLLRASAVLLVFFSHVPYALGVKSEWDFDSIGHYGVMMFFIHTSLVLSMSMARLEKLGNRMVRSFYIRRAFRIYPLSVLIVLVHLAFRIPSWFQVQFQRQDWLYVWSNLLLFQNLVQRNSVTGPLWSLPYEVQMYLVLPLIYFAGKRFRYPVGIAAGGLAVQIADQFLSRLFGYPPLFVYAPWFALGVALYFVKPKPRLSAGLYCGWLGLFVAASLVPHGKQGGYYVTAMVFCLLFRRFREIEVRWLCRPAHYIARYSYGIYLSHVPILWLAVEQMHAYSTVVRVFAFLLLMIATPILLYHAVEKPSVVLGARLAARVSKPAPLRIGG